MHASDVLRVRRSTSLPLPTPGEFHRNVPCHLQRATAGYDTRGTVDTLCAVLELYTKGRSKMDLGQAGSTLACCPLLPDLLFLFFGDRFVSSSVACFEPSCRVCHEE